MRLLATAFLVLGAADLVAIDVVIGPAAIRDHGAEGSRGKGPSSAPAITPVALPALPPMPVERAEPDLSPPRPPAVAAADPVRDPDRDPDPVPVPVPVPDPVSDPDPDLVPDPHPGSSPAPVTLRFDLDSDRIGQRSRAALDRVAALLEDRAELVVEIHGHADESGTEEHNQTLSERRAQRVADYLGERGVEATRLAVHAFGELQPLDPERARVRDRRNRRVEIRFASQNATGDTE